MRKAGRIVGPSSQATRAVVRVGDGRGFVVEIHHRVNRRYVITVAHCLPRFPPCHAASYPERTYAKLIGSLGEKPTVWAECVFVDPIADIAVLGQVDGQELYDEAAAWDHLIGDLEPLSIAKIPKKARVWLLSLDGQWRQANAEHMNGGHGIWISNAAGIEGGMSGSPISTTDGRAAGVIGTSGGGMEGIHTKGGPQPRLAAHLPAWFLAAAERRQRA